MARSKEFEINEVLDKAMHLFWTQGYEKTSMQDLVNYMGIHRRSIYDTFGDKHALYVKALERYEAKQISKIKFLTQNQKSIKLVLREMFESTIRKEGEPIGCFMVNSGVELGALDPEISSLVNASYIRTEEFLTTLIEAGQQTGEIKRDLNPVATALFLMNTWLGLRTLVKTTSDQQKLTSIIDMSLLILD
ncbi:TetR/AcrR family transcriptional regulator [Paenibacillus silvae]|uniref:TetR/AcrR family transcriptional regulator n=1 Tax=Paenibacillus silvae TaxID=1325358 RepID=A0A2W6NH32_9BACL|nr:MULTISPECIES: TetR/AcrR family transcriptional regulator [Paenibacillus]MCK6078179.1 TetR/AcrR family transcriptional regulator [Paenibacillus silvae]MCK6152521.1 TetR/AcrR family transcriptional regulator [Paenibacillus silvae]MCK6271084.1 TetR/AcrR family transcriptional regulator [Paenibacillus silvae]PZT55019.1 TetR/AcrR family transcriptional regulator [Paenibacillus silvae]